MAILAVAEMCVSFTTRMGRALIMMSGISTLQMARATTHWLAQRKMRPCSRQYTISRYGQHRCLRPSPGQTSPLYPHLSGSCSAEPGHGLPSPALKCSAQKVKAYEG